MMSWAKLFRSKAPKPKPDPRLRWFGKLPTYADYYNSTVDEAWTQEFNDWVLEGYDVYHRRLHGGGAKSRLAGNFRKRRLPISGCVIRLPKSGMTVLASIQDYGGDMQGRHFPIAFYVGVPTAQWPGPTSDRLAGATRVSRELTALRDDVIHFINAPGQFEAVFADRTVGVDGIDTESRDDSWVQGAKTVSLSDWFARAKGGLEVAEAESWFRLAEAWGRNIATNDSDGFEPTLRFPLAAGLSLEIQAAGWIRWLESRMNLERRFLSLMVSSDLKEGGGHLTIIAREIVRDDFLLLTHLAGTLPYVDDLAQIRDDGGRSGGAAAGGGANQTGGDAETMVDIAKGTGDDAKRTVSKEPTGRLDLSRRWADFVGGAP